MSSPWTQIVRRKDGRFISRKKQLQLLRTRENFARAREKAKQESEASSNGDAGAAGGEAASPPGSWEPSSKHKICNAHFIGNKKSDDPCSPAYVPALFDGVELDYDPLEKLARYNESRDEIRAQYNSKIQEREKKAAEAAEERKAKIFARRNLKRKKTKDCGVNTIIPKWKEYLNGNDLSAEDLPPFVFMCNRYIYPNAEINHAETQITKPCVSLADKPLLKGKKPTSSDEQNEEENTNETVTLQPEFINVNEDFIMH